MGTHTTNYDGYKPAVGEMDWGNKVNRGLDTIDAALKVVSDKVVALDGDANGIVDNDAGGTGADSSAWTGVVYVSSGTWAVEAQTVSARGGTGKDTSGDTGVPSISGGTWSVAATLANSLGGTGQDTSASTGVPSISTGTWSVAATLANTLGGTGQDTSSGTGFAKVSSGTWSVATITDNIEFVIDGGGSAIETGEAGHLEIGFACTITAVRMLADQSTSTVVDIWKDSYANLPPDNTDSITSAAPPTLSAAQKSEDATLTDWTTAITAGDWLAYNVDSNDNAERITISLTITRAA